MRGVYMTNTHEDIRPEPWHGRDGKPIYPAALHGMPHVEQLFALHRISPDVFNEYMGILCSAKVPDRRYTDGLCRNF